MNELLDAIRDLAWHSHVNLSSQRLYRRRQDAFARLRRALAEVAGSLFSEPPATAELGLLVRAAWRLAACSDSNRMGLPYYERKEAFAQVRGALAVYDKAIAA